MIRRLISLFLITVLLAACFSLAPAAAETQDNAGTALKISGSSFVAVGKKVSLKANEKVTWKSSDKKIATVTKDGVVKGIKAGTVKIYATNQAGEKITWKMTVVKKPVTSVKIKASTKELDLSDNPTVKLKAKASPSAAAQAFTWKSSDKSVATVSSSGKVTAKSAGTVKITATAVDGSKIKASVTLRVTDRYGKYVTVLKKIEKTSAQKNWTPERIRQAFIDQYGSETVLEDPYETFIITKDDVVLQYSTIDWYREYRVTYLNSKGKPMFRQEYFCLRDPSSLGPGNPTYYFHLEPSVYRIVSVSTPKAEYWLSYEYYGNTYIDKALYDGGTTIRIFTAEEDMTFYQGWPDD